MEKVLEYAKTLIKSVTNSTDYVVDATVGNGHDTLFLSKLVCDGCVYGFDIQKKAINNARELLQNNGVTNVTLFECSHEFILEKIPPHVHGRVSAGIFNLGYLPKGNKTVVTNGNSTILALSQLLSILKQNGIIVLIVYSGHTGGKEEMVMVLDYVKGLNQKEVEVLLYQFINQKNDAPFLIALKKL